MAVSLAGTSFGFSAVASGAASEVAGLVSSVAVDGAAGDGVAVGGAAVAGAAGSDFAASPGDDDAGVAAEFVGVLVGLVGGGGGADDAGVLDAGLLADAGAADDGAVELVAAGCDPAVAVGIAAGVDVVPSPEEGGGGVVDSGGSEVCVAAGALFVPERSQPNPWCFQRKYPKPTASASATTIRMNFQAPPPPGSSSSSSR